MAKSRRTTIPQQRAGSVNNSDGFSFGEHGAGYAQKDEYATKGLIFDIEEVKYEEGAGFDGADRWAVSVRRHDSKEVEIVTLGSNEKRDEQMQAALDYIETHGLVKNVTLKKSGRAYFFENVKAPK